MVDPSLTAPYSILVCFARSSAESMGASIRSTVRKAAKLAVQEEMMIKVKNHQIPPTIRVDRALGISSEPGGTVMWDKRLKNSQNAWNCVYDAVSNKKKNKAILLYYILPKQSQVPRSKWGYQNSWIHTRAPIVFAPQH